MFHIKMLEYLLKRSLAMEVEYQVHMISTLQTSES
jgi:hypothetical protein